MPRRVDAEQRMERLVDAARRVIHREGAHALSMAKVAREAGIAKATLFESCTREELLDRLFSGAPEIGHGVEGERVDDLLGALRERVDRSAHELQGLRLAEAARGDAARAREVGQEIEREEAEFAARLRTAMERGRIASMPPGRLALQMLASADGLSAHLNARRLSREERDARVEDLLALWRHRLTR